MKSATIVATLCYSIVTMGMAYPSEMTQDFEAQTQWHLRAPSHGCIEVSHSVGGTVSDLMFVMVLMVSSNA